MAKASAPANLDPNRFTQQAEILLEDAVQVIEQANFAAGEHPPALACFHCRAQGWGGSGAYVAHPPGVRFPPVGAGFVRRFFGRTLVDADAQSVRARLVTTMPDGDTGNVRLTVGGASQTWACAGGTETHTAALAAASVGSGWVDVVLELERLTSTGLGGLDDVTIQVEPIPATSLPDPD